MSARKELTDDEVLFHPHYIDILSLIGYASSKKKKIRFLHLRYALVKGADKKMKDKNKQKIEEFFSYPKDKSLISENKVITIKSELEYLKRATEKNEVDKISTANNLNGFLNNLIDLKFIEKKPDKKYPYYKITLKGTFYLGQWIIIKQVNDFLNYLSKQELNVKTVAMQIQFDMEIQNSLTRLFFSQKH